MTYEEYVTNYTRGTNFVRAARRAQKPPLDYLWPLHAAAATEWTAWFSWFPVKTEDHGWRWLRRVFYRRCFLKAHLYDGYKGSWFQYSGVKL